MPKKLTQEEFLDRLNKYTNNKVSLLTPYINKRTKVTVQCKECLFKWEISPQSLTPSEQYNFSGCPRCVKNQLREIVKCDYCGKEFEKLKSELAKSKSGYHYSSRECGNRHKNQIRKQNGEWEESANYRLKAFEIYPHKCLCCGWNEDERILEVHHINENHNDNDINNLCILCPICHRKITLGYYKLDINKGILIKNN